MSCTMPEGNAGFQAFLADAMAKTAALTQQHVRAWIAGGGSDEAADAAMDLLGAVERQDANALQDASWRLSDLYCAADEALQAEVKHNGGAALSPRQKQAAASAAQMHTIERCCAAIDTIAAWDERFTPRGEDYDDAYGRKSVAYALGQLPPPIDGVVRPLLPPGMAAMGSFLDPTAPFGSLIPGLIDKGDFGTIYGHPGAGKSFLGAAVAGSLVTGSSIFGVTPKPCAVVFLAAEGGARFTDRVRAWQARHGGDLSRLIVDAAPLNLNEPDGGDALMSRLRMAKQSLALPIGAVFIDTLTAAMGGADDSLGGNMGTFLAAVRRIQATGATVFAVHHKAKSGSEMRGHGSLNGACGFAIDVTATKAGNVARIAKLRDGPHGATFGFRIVPEGSSAVVNWQNKAGAARLNSGAASVVAAALAGDVAAAEAAGTPLTANGPGGVYRRRGTLSSPLRSLGRDPLVAACAEAVAAGLIRNVRGKLTAAH